jgi:hypothetical protein
MRRRWKALAGFELIVILIVGVGCWLNREPQRREILFSFPPGFSGPFQLTPDSSEPRLLEFDGGVFVDVDARGRSRMNSGQFRRLMPPTDISYIYWDGTQIRESGPSDGMAWAESKVTDSQISGRVHPATPAEPARLD